jgi:hypothetical protein
MKRLLLVIPLLAACSSVDPTATVTIKGPPDGEAFRPISAVVERRCGTLDCHGKVERPLRIYGQYGLRRPEDAAEAGAYPGSLQPTTSAELKDNYESMCGLEPEILDRVVAKKGQPEDLTLVRKPRLLEKHKGGLVWNKGDDGDTCVINWLTGVDDTSPCSTELLHP